MHKVPDVQVYYRGIDPTSIRDFAMTGYNTPVRIGSAIALELARAGADVVVHYAGRADKAQEIADQITAMGRSAQLIQADLTNSSACEGLIEKTGPVDILVLNASVQFRKKWDEITDDLFNMQINCNLRSSLKLIQQAVPHMRKQHWGRIVTIGSVQEAKPHPDMLVYAASKAAQSTMVRSLAAQLAKDGITVNNVASTIASGLLYCTVQPRADKPCFHSASSGTYAQAVSFILI